MIESFSKVRCNNINYKIAPRRPEYVAMCYAYFTKAKYSLDDICEDS